MKLRILLTLLLITSFAFAQDSETYKKPPAEILELADAPLAPRIRMDSKGENIIFLYRSTYKTIEELSETEMRLGGLRINPKTNIGSRVSYYTNMKVRNGRNGAIQDVLGLPSNGRYAYISMSNNEEKAAFTNTTQNGVELWVLDIKTASAKKLTDANLNANIGSPYLWFPSSDALLTKITPNNKADLINTKTSVSTGPTISVSEAGVKAQNRTYQDLLKNKNDEHNFEQLSRSELHVVNLDGTHSKWKDANMYRGMSFSPDGDYIMLTTIEKPFSYLVPYSRFPFRTEIFDTAGDRIATPLVVPLIEDLPKGFMATRTGKRSLRWRSDQPATLVWAEALDGGDPQNVVQYRDVVYQQQAPFTATPKELIKTEGRFSSIQWGNKTTAIANDYWWNTRNTKSYIFNPSDNSKVPKKIIDRNYQDAYNDPGSFETKKNKYGRYVLNIQNNKAFLSGDGFSDEGRFPFIDAINLNTTEKQRIYTSSLTDKHETILSALDIEKGNWLVQIESKSEYPNYYIKDINSKNTTPLTTFENPFKSIQDVKKEVITYKRDDGLELSATLYLPVGFDESKKYPMVLWAYPREYKDKNSASQNTQSSNEFTYPYYGSPIYWVTRGYVVLDDAAFPIVGEGNDQPNDTFVKQLVANAKAAIDAVDDLGYINRNKVAVGGHSYGAFMTANLLSHSNLFAAGIARSGAYNRTLTPFGFQSEERNYWEAPEIYYSMSPFMHADKMKTPLLLIHGEADNNSGTYPLQSERYFNALKGLGAPVRLVMLPKESHGYRAKESIFHMLWEQDNWLEKHLKTDEAMNTSSKTMKK